MESTARILLIRHAESRPNPDLPEAEWPLSEAGVEQASALADSLAAAGVEAVYSSPYLRARATVEPFAEAHGIEIGIESDLRERRLTIGFHSEWKQVIEKAWQDLGFALPGCESGLDCQKRLRRCVDSIAERNAGRTVALASHGNALALYLTLLEPSFGFEGWSRMKNPDVFLVEYVAGKPRWVRDFLME